MKEKSGKSVGKFFSLFVFVIVSSCFLINFISAYGLYDFRQGSEDLINIVVDFFEPFLQVLLGGGTWDGYLLFEKLILFVLLGSIVYLSISKISPFKDNKAVVWIIAIAIPLLGVRYLNFDWLNAIIIQYQVLGVVLTSILPFIIYFLFLQGLDYGVIRKVGWILFIVVYYGLWSTAPSQVHSQFYFWTIALSLILLFFDGTIHRWYMWEKIRASGKTTVEEAATAVRRKMVEAQEDRNKGILNDDQLKDRLNRLEKQLKEIYKHSF